MPLQRRSPSAKISAMEAAIFARRSFDLISDERAMSCCLRKASKMAGAAAVSPASDFVAASINLFVTPLMAETTATTGPR